MGFPEVICDDPEFPLPESVVESQALTDEERAGLMSSEELTSMLSCKELLFALDCSVGGVTPDSQNPYLLKLVDMTRINLETRIRLKDQTIRLEQKELEHETFQYLREIVSGKSGAKSKERMEASKLVLGMMRSTSSGSKRGGAFEEVAVQPSVPSGITEFKLNAARFRQLEGNATREDRKLLAKSDSSQEDVDNDP